MGTMRKKVDYSKIRGFNYTQSSARSYYEFGKKYDHKLVDREMGFAQRLNLNSARIFLNYQVYLEDKEVYLERVRDFVQTAWSHGISTNPILFNGFRFLGETDEELSAEPGQLKPLARTVEDPSCWHLGEVYIDDMIAAIGAEPGLLFWDIANEPGYSDDFVTWYEDEPEYLEEFSTRPDMKELREKQEKTWNLVRHFCSYVRAKDPEHELGVGNIFIFETDPSGTAPLVDVLIFHDYSATRGRMNRIYDYAEKMSKKYGKPLLNNETGCLCRANPYDMTLEILEERKIGWYLFELTIGEDMWSRAHGLIYPDGTIRDPAIIAALFGFYRRRKGTIVRVDVNQEDYVTELLLRIEKFFYRCRMQNHMGYEEEREALLELLEYGANILEAGELVPMNNPPTARVEALRNMKHPDLEMAEDWLYEMSETLQKACRLVRL